MTDLVTDAAIEACQRGQGCEESDGCICAEWIADGLKAAAPLIAAEALRQAASELLAFKSGQNLGYDRGSETALTYLGSRADELERE